MLKKIVSFVILPVVLLGFSTVNYAAKRSCTRPPILFNVVEGSGVVYYDKGKAVEMHGGQTATVCDDILELENVNLQEALDAIEQTTLALARFNFGRLGAAMSSITALQGNTSKTASTDH